jgi:DNA oxidative demethylase
MTGSLFEQDSGGIERIGEGAVVLRGFARDASEGLMRSLAKIVEAAPFRHMITPGGFRMSVAMTNCGAAGWVSDRRGYRYQASDPQTERPWPTMPESFRRLASGAAEAAGYPGFVPDACLVNRYEIGSRLTMHQDKNEVDYDAPIVSVSLGLPAAFRFGGMSREDRPRRINLESGDVVVWGGATRLAYHGVNPLKAGEHPLTGAYRINLTFRKAL